MERSQINDEKLVEMYLEGDEASFKALVDRHLPLAYGIARRYTGDRDKAADIAQETFVKVWRNLRSFDTKRSFRAWLYVIAEHTALDWLRGKEIPFSQTDSEAFDPPAPTDLAREADAKFASEKLRARIRELGPETEKIFNLHLQGLTFREIGARLGKSLNTIKSIYRRALLALSPDLNGAA